MPIAWTDRETLKLIKFYSQHECLRNPFNCDFKNKLCRYNAYKDIVHSMNVAGLTFCDCIKRITFMKMQYCYELSKIAAAISCEKFYRPKPSWFPLMHQLLFPFMNAYEFVDDLYEVQDKEGSTYLDYDSELNDEIKHINSVESRNERTEDKAKHIYSKKFQVQTKINKNASEMQSSIKNVLVNIGNNTCNNAMIQQETQTDTSCFIGTYKKSNKDLRCIKNIQVENDDNTERKHCGEFDMFGNIIAFQLQNINYDTALQLKKHIQDLITQELFNNIKSKSDVPCNISSDCSCSLSDCRILNEKVMCNCGLPLIMIKTDQFRNLAFK